MVGLSRVLRVLRTRFFIIFLVDFPSRGIGKIKGEFRVLRDAASLRGWIAPGRRPEPACRTLVLFALGAITRIVAYGLRAEISVRSSRMRPNTAGVPSRHRSRAADR